MTQRATNINNSGAKDYVIRGIGICDSWLSFKSFLDDMGEAPPGMSIDRIDNSKGYEPSNCRWATTAQQNRNRRHATNHYPGVFPSRTGKRWYSRITVRNMLLHIGSYDNYDDAVLARKGAEKLYWEILDV